MSDLRIQIGKGIPEIAFIRSVYLVEIGVQGQCIASGPPSIIVAQPVNAIVKNRICFCFIKLI